MPIYILAGDSITYGFWDTHGGWAGRLRSFLDQRRLEEADSQTLNTTRYSALYNLGIPGDTSAGLHDRFDQEVTPRLDSEQETVVLIAIGTNDSAYDTLINQYQVDIKKTQENITHLINSAKKNAQKVVVLGLPPVDEKRTNPIYWHPQIRYTNKDLEKYNQVIKKIAETEKVPFLDLFALLSKKDIAGLMEDGIHPNQAGHQMMFEIIKHFLLKEQII